MQKILLASITLIILVSFYFIKQDDKVMTSTLHDKIKVDTPLLQKEEIIPQVKASIEPAFAPSISLEEIQEKVSINIDKERIQPKPKDDSEIEKIVFLDIQKRITAEMKNIPNCLENASNKDEALKCNQELQKLHKEFELLLGIDNSIIPETTNDFVWNETTKENMIQELENSIQPMQEMHNCIQAAQTEEEQDKCFEVDDSEVGTLLL